MPHVARPQAAGCGGYTANTSVFDDGNYASNIFFLNGYYHFTPSGKWESYVSAGLLLVQEVDIDLERAVSEISLTSDGDLVALKFSQVNPHEHFLAWIIANKGKGLRALTQCLEKRLKN